MKKTIFLFLMLGCKFGISQKLTVGPEIGVNIIQVESEDLGKDYQLGLYAGGAVEYEINDWFAITTGLSYNQTRQAEVDYDTTAFDMFGFSLDTALIPGLDLNTYSTIYSRQSQSYIQLPIMGTFKWKDLSLSIGGYAGVMISALKKEKRVENTPFLNTIDISSMDPTGLLESFLPKPYEESNSESSEKETLNVFDYGLRTSIGYQAKNVGFNLTYNFGFPDYRKEFQTGKKRHQYFQLSVRYMLKVGSSGNARIQ